MWSAMPRFPPCFHTMSEYIRCCSLFILDSAEDEYKLICNWLVLALHKTATVPLLFFFTWSCTCLPCCS
uniref:Uncharacterized protein n=1 Tax=Triticum urartu TaxID=4572 RepID=A0A8R7TL94_TRIUA